MHTGVNIISSNDIVTLNAKVNEFLRRTIADGEQWEVVSYGYSGSAGYTILLARVLP